MSTVAEYPEPHQYRQNNKCSCGKQFASFGEWARHISDMDCKRIPFKRHPNSARFHEILRELGELHDKKQADYGRGDDPFHNVRASEKWGVKPWVGAMIRLNDKVARLQSLIENGKLENESVEDSMRDIAVYAAIALVLYEQEGAPGEGERL